MFSRIYYIFFHLKTYAIFWEILLLFSSFQKLEKGRRRRENQDISYDKEYFILLIGDFIASDSYSSQ